MKRAWRRITFRRPGVRLNPLIIPFLFYTFAVGVAFVMFPESSGVQASVLYHLTLGHLPDVAVSIWGVAAMLIPVMAVVGLLVRKKWLGDLTTWLGFALWLFATIIFGLYGYWLQVFSTGTLNLCFWIWYWWEVRDYYNNNEPPP